MVARTVEDILAARGVKPTLSPNLEVLAQVEALQVKRLLFIGVGCQVQAIRAIEPYLGLEALYVLGTNCVDNGRREGLDKFLAAASSTPGTALHYEFMQVGAGGAGAGLWAAAAHVPGPQPRRRHARSPCCAGLPRAHQAHGRALREGAAAACVCMCVCVCVGGGAEGGRGEER
jgi:hypothetical protein